MCDLDESEGEMRTDQFKKNTITIKNNIEFQSINDREISDDDDTIVLVLSDEEVPPIAELSSSEEKEIIAMSSKKSPKTSRTSTTSNNSTRGSNLIKQQSKDSAKILQDKSMIHDNKKSSVRKSGNAAIKFNFQSNRLPRKEPASQSLQEGNKTMSSSFLSLSEKEWPANTVEKPIDELTIKKTGLQADAVSPSKSKRTKEQSELHGDLHGSGFQFSDSRPEASKTMASTFQSLHAEKLPLEKAIKGFAVKKSSLRADIISPSTSKQTRKQSKLDGKKEEEKVNWPAKYKKLLARSESSVILVQRLFPSTIAEIVDQKKKSSLSEEKESSRVKSPISVNFVASTPEEKKVPEVVISKEELYKKSEKPLTRPSRGVGSASGVSENKKPRLSTDVVPVISVSSDSDSSVFTHGRSAAAGKQDKNSSKGGYSSSNEENEQDSLLELKLPTSRLRRKRVLRKVAPKWDPNVHADQMDTTYVDLKSKTTLHSVPKSNSIYTQSSDESDNEEASVNRNKSAAESKKTLAFMAKSKPRIRPKSSDELDNEEKSINTRKTAATEEVLENENVEFVCQQNYSSNKDSDSSPNGKLFKRGRGRPSQKSAPKSTVCSDPLMLIDEIDGDAKSENVLTRRMVYKRTVESKTCAVAPPKKRRNLMTLVRSEDIQHEKMSLSTDRRGFNSATSSGKIEKSSAVPVASCSTTSVVASCSTTSVPLTGIRMECRVLLTRDPEIEALCMTQQAVQLNKQFVTATKVSRGSKKLVGKSKPIVPIRKLRPRQV